MSICSFSSISFFLICPRFLRFASPQIALWFAMAVICHGIVFVQMHPHLRASLHNRNSLYLFILVHILKRQHLIGSSWIRCLSLVQSVVTRMLGSPETSMTTGAADRGQILLEWVVDGNKMIDIPSADIICFMFLTLLQIWDDQSQSWNSSLRAKHLVSYKNTLIGTRSDPPKGTAGQLFPWPDNLLPLTLMHSFSRIGGCKLFCIGISFLERCDI